MTIAFMIGLYGLQMYITSILKSENDEDILIEDN